jgi:hypothetical protein
MAILLSGGFHGVWFAIPARAGQSIPLQKLASILTECSELIVRTVDFVPEDNIVDQCGWCPTPFGITEAATYPLATRHSPLLTGN